MDRLVSAALRANRQILRNENLLLLAQHGLFDAAPDRLEITGFQRIGRKVLTGAANDVVDAAVNPG